MGGRRSSVFSGSCGQMQLTCLGGLQPGKPCPLPHPAATSPPAHGSVCVCVYTHALGRIFAFGSLSPGEADLSGAEGPGWGGHPLMLPFLVMRVVPLGPRGLRVALPSSTALRRVSRLGGFFSFPPFYKVTLWGNSASCGPFGFPHIWRE